LRFAKLVYYSILDVVVYVVELVCVWVVLFFQLVCGVVVVVVGVVVYVVVL